MTVQNNKWYVNGLHFNCVQCGNCCAGPEEGYIWISRREIQMLAEYLNVSEDNLRQKYLKKYGKRSSIKEIPETKDCIFLTEISGMRGCSIYPVRPNQCRTWPFWTANLTDPDEWNMAGLRCPGINRGKLYTFEEIEEIRKQKKWWPDD